MSKTPLLGGKKSPELDDAAGIQPHGRVSDAGADLSGGSDQNRPAPCQAKNTGGPVLSFHAGANLSGGKDQERPPLSLAKNTAGPALSSDAGTNLSAGKNWPAPSEIKNTGAPPLSSHAGANLSGGKNQSGGEAGKHQSGGEAGVGVITPRGQQVTTEALANLAMRLGGAQLAEVFAKSLPKKKPVNGGKKRESEDPSEIDLDVFTYQSRVFALFSRHTTMAAAANAFSVGVESFVSGKDNKKRVADTKLSEAGMILSVAAHRAPRSEAVFVDLATRLTGDAQVLLLSDAKPVPLRSRWKWRPAASDGPGRTSRMERLLAATNPILPVHTAKGSEKVLIDKRQIMYAVAVTLPVSLLASAAGLHVFVGQGAWAAGVGVCVWILAAAGMVLNQYGKLNWELFAARHLNRLSLLGGAILLSFYAFSAYFPSEAWALWLLIGLAVTLFGVPWIMSMIRADDIASA